MADRMDVELDDSEWRAVFARATRLLINPRPMLDTVGLFAERSIKKRLRAGGPGPEGEPYQPLSETTLSVSRRGRKADRPLVDTGQTILGGIRKLPADRDSVAVVSGFEYSHVHQFGMDIKGTAFGDITIPARPFMSLAPDDPEAIANIARLHLTAVLKGGITSVGRLLPGGTLGIGGIMGPGSLLGGF